MCVARAEGARHARGASAAVLRLGAAVGWI